MISFEDFSQARAYVKPRVEYPVEQASYDIDKDVRLRTYPIYLDDGAYTNVYDLSWSEDTHRADIVSFNQPDYVTSSLQNNDMISAFNAGFFILADHAVDSLRQPHINMLVTRGQIRSLPIFDSDVLFENEGRLNTRYIRAFGEVLINNAVLNWAGSLTDYKRDVEVFSASNITITHAPDPATASRRVLSEKTRFTSRIAYGEGLSDLGCQVSKEGDILVAELSRDGELDLLKQDFVLRCPSDSVNSRLGDNSIRIVSIDDLPMGSVSSALTVGPNLQHFSYATQPINSVEALGSKPPFDIDRRLARLAVIKANSIIHAILFDARPGSRIFTGVTPREAKDILTEVYSPQWGCFLDPGLSAKIATRGLGGAIRSYGNRHFIAWPKNPGEPYIWEPDRGRAVMTAVTLGRR